MSNSSGRSSSFNRISPEELRAGAWLALVFGLRMLGLFLVLPVFSVYAKTLPGGENIMWAGIAMGAFALTQAILQIPLGFASDHWGRKPVIVVGLLVYALGSLMAAWAPTISWLIVARCCQGSGAISAAISALAADLTREQHRAKVMAMIGASIGVVFSVSLVGAPALYAWIGMQGIFVVIGVLAIVAIGVVLWAVPRGPIVERSGSRLPVSAVLRDGQLLRLNFGIFSKHMMQMAMFLVVPRMLVEQYDIPLAHHWMLYLPVVLGSFVLAVPGIIFAEKYRRFKMVFLFSIGLILLSQTGLLWGATNFVVLLVMLFVFFVAFNVLEATMPALVSRIAPPQLKGLALGAFNTSQALGAGLGAAAGGWLAFHAGAIGVFSAAIVLSLIWGCFALSMKIPVLLEKREYFVAAHIDIDRLREKILGLPGVGEVIVTAEVASDQRMAYLKINPERFDEVRLRHLIEGEA